MLITQNSLHSRFEVCLLVLWLFSFGTVATAETESSRPQIVFWRAIKDSKDPALFEDLIKKFPSSPFATLARVRSDELRGVDRSQARHPIGNSPPPLRIPENSRLVGVETPSIQ
jgi:hypothetical protein